MDHCNLSAGDECDFNIMPAISQEVTDSEYHYTVNVLTGKQLHTGSL